MHNENWSQSQTNLDPRKSWFVSSMIHCWISMADGGANTKRALSLRPDCLLFFSSGTSWHFRESIHLRISLICTKSKRLVVNGRRRGSDTLILLLLSRSAPFVRPRHHKHRSRWCYMILRQSARALPHGHRNQEEAQVCLSAPKRPPPPNPVQLSPL